MINLEVPKKFRAFVNQAHQVAAEMLRPNSREYDLAEHAYPKELDMLAAMVDGLSASGTGTGAGASGVRRTADGNGDDAVLNGSNLSSVLSVLEMCWGDVGLLLSMPRQGLGNQRHRLGRDRRAARAVQGHLGGDGDHRAGLRLGFGRDPDDGPPDGDDYVLNGEKIFVTAGGRCDAVVVWATLDRARPGRDQVVRGAEGHGRADRRTARAQARHPRLRHRDHPPRRLPGAEGEPARQPGDRSKGFAGVMQTFDNTRPMVAPMAVGCARAALEVTRELLAEGGVEIDYDRPAQVQPAAAATFLQLEADYEAAYLLTLQAAWMADNSQPNSLQASMAKAKAGRVGNDITLRCVELAGSVGYSEHELLEKWARDSKILDIFEGTQQIQQLIIARRLLGKTSAELK